MISSRVGHGGIDPTEVAHVVIVDVDVKESVQRAVVVEQLALDRRKSFGHVREDRADRRALNADRGLAAHRGSQDGGDTQHMLTWDLFRRRINT